ncbi:hypothetical protein diail_4706 [Diaporthe ilicicola]|nr:hypothetical protein diail_4706 [Diaporthe ilicicola]
MSSKDKGKGVEQLRLCRNLKAITNPPTPERWRENVKKYLSLPEPSNILLSGLRQWRVGTERSNSFPSGSKLGFENFLHFRCLVQTNDAADLSIEDYVDQPYIEAARRILATSTEFLQYQKCVHNGNPDLDVSGLGLLGSAKILQNHVLIDAYKPATGPKGKGREAQSQTPQSDDEYESDLEFETPYVRRFVTPDNLLKTADWSSFQVTDADAFDEMIVNEAALEYLSALTRSFMKKLVYENSPTRDQEILDHERTLARWTIARNKFVIQEHRRPKDNEQTANITYKYNMKEKDQANKLKYVPVLETQTDGYLYSVDNQEVLAIVEVKRGLRGNNKTRIEWQEAAEILGWLNIRLRTEREEQKANPGAKMHRADRRGLLNPTQDGKYRCLLVSQDRDQISIVIGEWDKFYEYYAVEGRLPTSKPTAVARPSQPQPEAHRQGQAPAPQTPVRGERARQKVKDIFHRDPVKTTTKSSTQKGKGRASPTDASGSERDNYDVDADTKVGPDQGFMKLIVYGPFSTKVRDDMDSLSLYLLAMSMSLAQVPEQTLSSEYLYPSRPSSRGRSRGNTPPDRSQEPPGRQGHPQLPHHPGPSKPPAPSSTGNTSSKAPGNQAASLSSTRAIPGQHIASSRPTKGPPLRDHSRTRPGPTSITPQGQPSNHRAQGLGQAPPGMAHQKPSLATPPRPLPATLQNLTDPRALRQPQPQIHQHPTTPSVASGARQGRSPAATVASQGSAAGNGGGGGDRTLTGPILRPNRSEGNLRAGYTSSASNVPPLPTGLQRDQAVARERGRNNLNLNSCAQSHQVEERRMPQSPIAA